MVAAEQEESLSDTENGSDIVSGLPNDAQRHVLYRNDADTSVIKLRRNRIMLVRFAVENYKNFGERVELPFDRVRNYGFNGQFVKDGLLNKAMVVGRNGTGKTNLGLALFDIVPTVTDNPADRRQSDARTFLNGDSMKGYATFEYVFRNGSDTLRYEYRKTRPDTIVYERLDVNGEMYFCRDGGRSDYTRLKRECAPDLRIRIGNGPLSVLRYVNSNTDQARGSPVSFIADFANRMLYFRSDTEGNTFIGPGRSETIPEYIAENGLEDDFAEKLSELGNIKVDISAVRNPDIPGFLVQQFGRARLDFASIASSGTRAFMLFYYWSRKFGEISFLYMDEFDAYYHFGMALNVLRYVASDGRFQTVFTTHNTALIGNEVLRPDCYMVLEPDGLRPFPEATDRELREGHNLSKMYRNGEFGY